MTSWISNKRRAIRSIYVSNEDEMILHLKEQYVLDKITLEEFEHAVSQILLGIDALNYRVVGLQPLDSQYPIQIIDTISARADGVTT